MNCVLCVDLTLISDDDDDDDYANRNKLSGPHMTKPQKQRDFGRGKTLYWTHVCGDGIKSQNSPNTQMGLCSQFGEKDNKKGQ